MPPERPHAPTFNLAEILRHQNQGQPRALYAACTANGFAIQAVLQQARRDGTPALIESTPGQVNLSGGYSGLTPDFFRRQVLQMAAENGLAPGQVILGGDHIGPHPWRHMRGGQAMQRAAALTAACVAAGYRKLHLDPVSPCGDDPLLMDGSLPLELVSRRTAELCHVAEQAAEQAGISPPIYVIGSDVPPPGGENGAAGPPSVTDPGRLRDFLSACRRAFQRRELLPAWERVCAVVVHTGAAFSPLAVHPYSSERLKPLASFIRQDKRRVLEAHSTDFQTEAALAAMVKDHCRVLKVGPALTYALREALFALAEMERRILGTRKDVTRSRLPEVMERLMVAEPGFWQTYYQGSEQAQAHLRQHALSDRIRYYWARPEAEAARQQLFANLRRYSPPLDLVRECLPEAAEKIGAGRLANNPDAIVLDRVGQVTKIYARACRLDRVA